MTNLLSLGQMLSAHARLRPGNAGARDLERSMTFLAWNRRACRLANVLRGLGLRKGDRVAVLAYNCFEWAEIYAATAKAGLVVVPANFRLVAAEAAIVIEDAEASAIIAQAELAGIVEDMRERSSIPAHNYLCFGTMPRPPGWHSDEDLLSRARDTEPGEAVAAHDPWTLMYT
jgi:fatty-acyl-CoA synthase